jgi:hypothetical protein
MENRRKCGRELNLRTPAYHGLIFTSAPLILHHEVRIEHREKFTYIFILQDASSMDMVQYWII